MGLGRRFTFQPDYDLKHPARVGMEWARSKHINEFEWSGQSPGLNPTENLWQNLKVVAHKHFSSNLTELEQFNKEVKSQ